MLKSLWKFVLIGDTWYLHGSDFWCGCQRMILFKWCYYHSEIRRKEFYTSTCLCILGNREWVWGACKKNKLAWRLPHPSFLWTYIRHDFSKESWIPKYFPLSVTFFVILYWIILCTMLFIFYFFLFLIFSLITWQLNTINL